MRNMIVLPAALALALLAGTPAWAIVDLNLSAEYVTGGQVDASGLGESDLKGGVVLRGMASFLGFTAGAESYTDTVKDGDNKLSELALKAGYGFGFPGVDLTFLATYEDWKITKLDLDGAGPLPEGDLELKDILVGVDATFTLLPVFDVEAWYGTSVSSDVSGASTTGLTGLDGSGFTYGLRLIYKVGMGFGVSAGYRVEQHKLEYSGSSLTLDTNGYTLGVDYRF